MRNEKKSKFKMFFGMGFIIMSLILFSIDLYAIEKSKVSPGSHPPAPRLGSYKITVAAPNGGEKLIPGSTYKILWKIVLVREVTGSEDPVTTPIANHYVKLFYSINSGTTWIPIVTATHLPTSPGSFDWTVPMLNNITKGRIKAQLMKEGSPTKPISTDTSDADFSISK